MDDEFDDSVEEGPQATSDAPVEDAVPDAVEAPVTGDAAVDDAVTRLAQLQGATLEEQLPVLEAVHRTLQDRLADVEG